MNEMTMFLGFLWEIIDLIFGKDVYFLISWLIRSEISAEFWAVGNADKVNN